MVTNNKYNFNIIIPVYKQLDLVTKTSISSLYRNIKEDYDVFFLVPENECDCVRCPQRVSRADDIRNSIITYLTNDLGTTNFKFYGLDYRWFQSKSTYSSLLLTSEFYTIWLSMGYEKSFIFQTDCYLFRDEFEQWANTNYNFIGAPVIATNSDWGYYGGYVGNGGFSMRDNRFFYNIFNRNNKLWKEHGNELESRRLVKHSDQRYIDYEDIFICRLLPNYIYVNIPSPKKAAEFAYDRNPFECQKHYKVGCPMAAHNYMLQVAYWKKYIDEFKSDTELYRIANNTVIEWNKLDHPELHGQQSADPDDVDD